MRGRIAVLAVLFAVAAPTWAATERPVATPTALAADTEIRENDSPLVKAAKKTLARRKAGTAAVASINDDSVRLAKKTFTTSSGSARLPDRGWGNPAPEFAVPAGATAVAVAARPKQPAVAPAPPPRGSDAEGGPYGDDAAEATAPQSAPPPPG